MKIGFIGFQGVGKTTIGRQVAALLSLPWYDLDEVIANGASIVELYKTLGDAQFRALESQAVQELSQGSQVISFGGGALDAIRVAVGNGMQMHYLYLPQEVLWAKFEKRKPLWLQPCTEARFQEIWDLRHNSFLAHSVHIHDISSYAESDHLFQDLAHKISEGGMLCK